MTSVSLNRVASSLVHRRSNDPLGGYGASTTSAVLQGMLTRFTVHICILYLQEETTDCSIALREASGRYGTEGSTRFAGLNRSC